MVDRDAIETMLRRLNAAENGRSTSSTEAVSAGIDEVMAPDVEGWRNGVHVPDRAAERRVERGLFDAVPDYHRDIERMVIDPPFASIGWTIRGTVGDDELEAPGSSTFEFGADGRVVRYWLHFDPAAFAPLARAR